MTFAVEASEVASAAYMVVACMAAAFVVAAYTSDPVVERNSDLDHILVEAPVDTCPVEAPVDTCPAEASVDTYPVEDYSLDQDYNNLGPYLSSLYY